MDARRARLDATLQREDPAAPLWEPRSSDALTTSDVLNRAPIMKLPDTSEAALIGLLVQPITQGETHRRAYALRERAIREHFATLEPAHAYEVARRLDVGSSDDPLVAAFARLSIERRLRLRAFLEAAKVRARRAGPP